MKPSELKDYLKFAFNIRKPVLITGRPGIGKSQIVEQALKELGYDFILDHPVVSDPTDFKGLPFEVDGLAEFLPFKNLRRAINATVPTGFFLDDLGQAPVAVQSAVMQLLLARQVGEHKISDNVVFVAATNRKKDKAGVTGILEPVKSRFTGGIIELEVSVDDWVDWAYKAGMPSLLIAFVKFKPNILDEQQPSKEIMNVVSPRTLAGVGEVLNAGLESRFYNEVFKGIAGEVFGTEFATFLRYFEQMPKLEDIFKNPKGTIIPDMTGVKYALITTLSEVANRNNIDAIFDYTERMGNEFQTACLKFMAYGKQEVKKEVFTNKRFSDWAVKHANKFE